MPVSFHVDYWNRLGWRDRFASKQFTERQHAYARSWNADTVYTPGFVINGGEWRGWFDRREPPSPSRDLAGVLTLTRKADKEWELKFVSVSTTKGWDAWLALLGSDLSSEVKAGENRGRTLRHHFVALALDRQKMSAKDRVFSATFPLDATTSQAAARLAVAAWVSPADSQAPAQAVGGWLTESAPAAEKASRP